MFNLCFVARFLLSKLGYMYMYTIYYEYFNTLRPRQNGRHSADDTFKRIFVNENARILNGISLKFFPNGPINNILALFQIMAWRRPGDKPLSEAMMVCLPTHICVTRPQWVKPHCCKCNILDVSMQWNMVVHATNRIRFACIRAASPSH